MLWFKNDLRVDDHPGLLAACRAASGSGAIVPVFVFDPEVLAPTLFSPAGPEVLVASVLRLRRDLRRLGSDLVVRQGACDEVLAELAQQYNVRSLVTEHEVEHRWRLIKENVQESFKARARSVPTFAWRSAVWDEAVFSENYRDWRRARGAPLPPLPAPESLPPLPAGLPSGDVPSVAQLREALGKVAALAAGIHAISEVDDGPWRAEAAKLAEVVMAGLTDEQSHAARMAHEAEEEAVQILRAYLGERSGSPSLAQFLQDRTTALELGPSSMRASFPALFGPAMAVGAYSRRRVLWEAKKLSAQPTAAAAAAASATFSIECSEFHWHLAARHEERQAVPGAQFHSWRWRNVLTEYCVAEPSMPLPGSPAVLLVHGFGAFGDQWRGNIAQLAAAGYRVFAPTIPGFGRSEKAAMPYSQDTWRDFLRDFMLQIVRAPAVVAGNSIGGFIAASCAGDYPGLVKGLILINAAGPIDPGFNIASWREAAQRKKPPPRWFVEFLSSALFWYLENSIAGSLKWLYPSDKTNADEWLAKEIYRAACDSGSIEVFRAVFYLPPPRALNYMVAQLYRGPTLVLQGALDPLNDAKGRAQQMKQLCSNVEVVLLQAGHCPHDERPDLVNPEILRFVKAVMAKRQTSDLAVGVAAA